MGWVLSHGVIREKSFAFALDIVRLYCRLRNDREYVVSRQLLRSGTSIGANVEEATAAESRKDFVPKMAVAAKEAWETKYWLRLLQESDLAEVNVTNEIERVDELIRILTSIVKTTKEGVPCGKNVRAGSNSKLKTLTRGCNLRVDRSGGKNELRCQRYLPCPAGETPNRIRRAGDACSAIDSSEIRKRKAAEGR